MRGNKFRAWNRELKKFELFELAGHAPITTCQIPAKGTWNILDDWEQYTGRKDILGSKVYEGDILQNRSGRGPRYVVKYSEHELGYTVSLIDVPGKNFEFSLSDIICSSIAVGNIHEEEP